MAPLFPLAVELAVLLCLPWMVLGQDDCLTMQGRDAWAASNLDITNCGLPLLAIYNSQDNPQLKDASKIQSVCTEECAGKFRDFLQSTKECRESPEVQYMVAGIESRLCAFYANDSVNEPESSCFFSAVPGRVDANQTTATLTACFQWWLPSGSKQCSENCTQALQTNIDRVGCCYQAFFSDPNVVNKITLNFNQTLMERGLGPIPNDLQVNIADSDLLTACGITTPETCPSSLPQEQRDTSYAQRDVAVPLTTLLAAIISMVAYFY